MGFDTQALDQTIDIGPGNIATPAVEGGPAFALSSAEWADVQTYVITAQDPSIVPTTLDQLRARLGEGAPSDLSDFTQLVNTFANINGHVTTWQDDTFPASVALASDIVSYAQQARIYYAPILPLANKLVDNPDDQRTKDKLAAILDSLIQKANTFHDNAAAVKEKIKTFAEQTQQDKTAISGADGASGLMKYYDDKYGQTSEEVTRLTDLLKGQKAILDAANKEYNHDVIVASTTPTYGWIFPFGTIAAAIVAGVYADKAVKALERANAAQQQINTLDSELQANANLMTALMVADSSLDNINGSLAKALPVIQKIQGVWGAISDDLSNISKLIKTNIQEALPIIMDLGVDAAVDAWTAVGQAADAYRVNAYITVNK